MFSAIEIPDDIKKIDFRRNELISFIGMPNLKFLQLLNVSDIPIENLRGFQAPPSLSEISLLGTPLAAKPNFRISIVALCGASLRLINGERVTASERQLASLYGGPYEDLIRAGWDMQYPPPKGTELRAIREQLLAKTLTTAAAPARGPEENEAAVADRQRNAREAGGGDRRAEEGRRSPRRQ